MAYQREQTPEELENEAADRAGRDFEEQIRDAKGNYYQDRDPLEMHSIIQEACEEDEEERLKWKGEDYNIWRGTHPGENYNDEVLEYQKNYEGRTQRAASRLLPDTTIGSLINGWNKRNAKLVSYTTGLIIYPRTTLS